MRTLVLALALVAGAASAADPLEKSSVSTGKYDVPLEIARPAGPGPFPPVLYIHAKRGFEDEDRAHMRELAAQGFLVLAPDWQKGNMIERWPDRHYPETEADVEAGLTALLARKDVCKGPVGVVALSRGPYFAIRLAAKRPDDIAAIVSYYGHFQNPNAPEPQQLFSVAPEIAQIRAPVLMLIGDADYEVRRMVNGRAFYALWARGIPVELQMYPMARRAFDFRPDASPEEKVATRHARQRARTWLATYLKVGSDGRCAG
ncbi:MAG TPA: dienelactone hydrolase family protein [Burkholderiaceae bacterium]|nr:dienelactone hydrolase family protein [Burkholderiaceae bacterium]